jgi:hypothetical protein
MVPRIHIERADYNASHTSFDELGCASGGAPARRARLERYVQDRIGRYATSKIPQTRNLSVGRAGATMIAFCDDAFAPDEDRTYSRIRARAPERFPRFAQSCAHETLIVLRSHREREYRLPEQLRNDPLGWAIVSH